MSSPQKLLTAALALTVVGCSQPTPAPVPAPTPAAPATATPGEKPTLLVMPLRAEADLEVPARALDEMILTAIDDLDRYEVLGPSDLNALLGVEALKDALGCDEVSCAAEIGGALGAPFLVAGQLGKLGSQAVLSLRLMDTQAPAVLERSSTRGTTDGNALAKMMASAVGDLFDVEVAVGEVTEAPATPTAPPATDNAYLEVLNDIGRQMSNGEYTTMLQDLDRYEQQTFVTPPTIDMPELLTYYRAHACSTLKRMTCFNKALARYRARWPRGMYLNSLETMADQFADAALQSEAGAEDLPERIAEIERLRSTGALGELEAREAIAYLYYGARQWDVAAEHFFGLVKTYGETNPQKAMETLSTLVLLLEQNGRFDEARKLLLKAKTRHPKLFRLNGLHHHLRRLPK